MFQYPLNPCPKVTVICDTMNVSSGCTHLAENNTINPHALRTETLAAPASMLLDLSEGWMPRFPLVAFTGTRHGFLNDVDRERLWRRFAVPVFEQLIDDQGNIDYNRISLFSTADSGATFSYARRLKIEGLQYGVNAKVIRRIIGKFSNSTSSNLPSSAAVTIALV